MNEDKDINMKQYSPSLEEILKSVSEEHQKKFQEIILSIQNLIELTEKVRQRNENKKNNSKNGAAD